MRSQWSSPLPFLIYYSTTRSQRSHCRLFPRIPFVCAHVCVKCPHPGTDVLHFRVCLMYVRIWRTTALFPSNLLMRIQVMLIRNPRWKHLQSCISPLTWIYIWFASESRINYLCEKGIMPFKLMETGEFTYIRICHFSVPRRGPGSTALELTAGRKT